MHTDHEHDDHGQGHGHGTQGIGYEKSDLDIGMLIKMGIALGIMTIGSYVICVPLIRMMGGHTAGFYFGPDEAYPDKAGVARRKLPDPPAPLLQDNITAHSDMANLRRKEHEQLDKDGVNPETGEATISIEKAMEEEAATKQ